MVKSDLLKKVKARKNQIGLTVDNIAKLSQLTNRTVTNFLAGENVKISTIKKVTHLLGLDFQGNEVVSIDELEQNRAKEKALYIVSLVQDTSSLEGQGLDEEDIDLLIEQAKNSFLHEYKKNLWTV